MTIYYYKVDLFEKDDNSVFIGNEKIVVKAESPGEAGGKLREYFSNYSIKHHLRGQIDDIIE